jgi:hypothetical protein
MATKAAALLAALALGLGAAARADVWDLGTDTDNDSGSDNEIVHGLSQVHDLAAQAGGTVADEDWYPFRLAHGRSFELRVDGMTGDLAGGTHIPTVELRAGDGTTVVQTAESATSFGIARSLRVASNVNGTVGDTTYYVRVANPGCALTCTANDEYRIRAFDTTLALPRFNNTNGQVTVLILQNPGNRTTTYSAAAWTNGGVYLGSFGAVLAPYETSVTNLSTVNSGALANQSGSLVIRNDGPYLGLAGKGVAVEPATGFTFDTALTPVPR